MTDLTAAAGPYPVPELIAEGLRVRYAGNRDLDHGTYTAIPCTCWRCDRHTADCPACLGGNPAACEDGGILYTLTGGELDLGAPADDLAHVSRRSIMPEAGTTPVLPDATDVMLRQLARAVQASDARAPLRLEGGRVSGVQPQTLRRLAGRGLVQFGKPVRDDGPPLLVTPLGRALLAAETATPTPA